MKTTREATMKTKTMIAAALTGVLLVLVSGQTPVLAAPPVSFQTLAQRLPAASNAVVAVNVSKVLASPYAKREHWGSNAADAWAKQPVMIPPGARRLIMAAA